MSNSIELLQNAVAFHRAGELEKAEQLYRQVLRQSPNQANALCMFGLLASQVGQVDSAINLMERAVAVAPEIIETHRYLGSVLAKAGRLDEARHCYQRAIQWHPRTMELHFKLGDVLRVKGDCDAAIGSYKIALDIEPNCPEAHNNLGLAQVAMRELDSAVSSFLQAIEFRPDFPEAYFNLSCVYRELGRYDLSAAAGRQALQKKPGLGEAILANVLQHMCDWDGLQELSNHLLQRVEEEDAANDRYPVHPFAFLGLHIATTAEQQWKCARQWARSKGLDSLGPKPIHRKATKPRNRGRIRLGYLSADFHDHPVAYLTAELFEQHDRQRFDVFGYSLGFCDNGSMRRRIAAGFDGFREIRNGSAIEAARRIADDEIDILIDLQGYTLHARTEILALRPAPIQVSYLGYPASMGTTCINYILVDDFIVPADQQPFYSETLVHLPGCFMVNDRYRSIASRTPARSELGLPEHGLVFCAFSSSYKISEEIFNVWLRSLRSVPDSVLWLRDNNPFASENLLRYAKRLGIASERLVFAPTVPMSEHLSRHRAADLFLDTFPYNQHSTASDALRMGLPVVTVAGQTFASRVAGSLLTAIGMTGLIAHNVNEYESLIRRLAQNSDELKRARDKLALNLRDCSLFDGQAFARNIEKIYETIFDRHLTHESSPR